MAPKQSVPNNLETYVRGKDASNDKRTGKTVSLEDLKYGTNNNTPPANSRQLRSQHPGVAQQRAQGSETQRRRQSDDSSIGATSETPSTRQIQAAQHAVAPNGFATNGDRPEYSAQSSEGDLDDQDGVGADDSQSDELSQSAMNIMQGVGVELENQRAGRSLPYIKGDSYPSTTSGPASVQEVETRNPLPMQQSHAPVPAAPQNRRHGQPPPQGAPLPQRHNRAQPQSQQGQQQQDQSQTTNLQISRPDTPEQFRLHLQAVSGFAFGAPPKPKASTKAPTTHQRQGEASANHSRQPLATDAAQRPPLTEADRVNRQPAREIPTQAERKPMQGEKRVHGPSKATPQPAVQSQQAAQPARQIPTPPQQITQPARQIPLPQQRALRAAADTLDHKDHDRPETPVEEELQLDYEVPELYSKDYAALKNQSFDDDPQQPQKGFPSVATDDPIETQVKNVASFGPEDQHNFLASLPIDEWEQAGDWFLGRFGGILANLKTLRQEKRKAARAFEMEIESRHVAVTKKRKTTEAALGDMRTSGSMVLTPKKSKK